MAQVTTGLWHGPVFGLAPGAEHHWFADNALPFGQVQWFFAHPLAANGIERSVEVVETFCLTKTDGTRQINVHVRNNGDNTATYSIFYAFVGP